MTAILERYGLGNLNPEERREVAKALLNGLPEIGPEDEWEDWEVELIRERIAASDANPNGGITLAELKKEWADVP